MAERKKRVVLAAIAGTRIGPPSDDDVSILIGISDALHAEIGFAYGIEAAARGVDSTGVLLAGLRELTVVHVERLEAIKGQVDSLRDARRKEARS
jgi:hypothetical protein